MRGLILAVLLCYSSFSFAEYSGWYYLSGYTASYGNFVGKTYYPTREEACAAAKPLLSILDGYDPPGYYDTWSATGTGVQSGSALNCLFVNNVGGIGTKFSISAKERQCVPGETQDFSGSSGSVIWSPTLGAWFVSSARPSDQCFAGCPYSTQLDSGGAPTRSTGCFLEPDSSTMGFCNYTLETTGTMNCTGSNRTPLKPAGESLSSLAPPPEPEPDPDTGGGDTGGGDTGGGDAGGGDTGGGDTGGGGTGGGDTGGGGTGGGGTGGGATDPLEPPPDEPLPADTTELAKTADVTTLGNRLVESVYAAANGTIDGLNGLAAKLDGLGSKVDGLGSKLDGIAQGVGELAGGGEYAGESDSGTPAAAGEAAGDLASLIDQAVDDVTSARDDTFNTEVEKVDGMLSSWFGDDPSQLGGSIIDSLFPPAVGCSQFVVPWHANGYSIVLPVCELTRVKSLLEWVFGVLTAIAVWRILMNTLNYAAAGHVRHS